MRRKLSAGVLLALAFLIPAAPATAQAAPPVLGADCKPIERKVFKDFRELVTIDLDTATDLEVRVQSAQILTEANAESLPVLPVAIKDRLKGTAADLRTFLKTGLEQPWRTDLLISVNRTMPGAGKYVQSAAQTVLDDRSIDVMLAYLNDGLYAARALDCASQPTATPSVTPTATTTPSVTPSATTTAVVIPSASVGPDTSGDDDGEGGGLPVTGSATGAVAAIGGALLLLGAVAYLITRRRRSRFVA